MKKNIIKTTILSISAVLLLSACSNNQEKMNLSKAIASDATESEIKRHEAYLDHIKKVKKRKKRVALKKKEINLDKFCFKDNHSIHYRAEERCK